MYSPVFGISIAFLKYLQALSSYSSDIQAHLLNSEIRQVVHPNLKNRQSKIALKQTLTLKLGVTLLLTVTQVYVFVNLCRVTGVPP